MRIWTALLLTLLATRVMAADVAREVPDQFVGNWCTQPMTPEEDTGESDIGIGRSEIAYYQSVGKIVAAAAVGDNLALIVQINLPGEVRLATHEFELSDNGSTLTSLRHYGRMLIRRRCGASPGGA